MDENDHAMMEPDMQSYEQFFQHAVATSFAFLESEYGFELAKKTFSWVVWASSKCRVGIYLERHQVFATIEPICGNEPPIEYASSNAIGLQMILRCRGAESDYDIPFELRPNEVTGAVQKLAVLLKKYCRPFMEGDFSEWSRLMDCALKEAKAMNAKFRKTP